MWELDHKESWVPKSWCFWTMVLEKTLESPLNCKEIKPVYPMGNQSWIFIGRTDAGAKTPILWPPDEKNWLLGKDPNAGKDWRQEKGTTEDEMVGWHQFNGHEFEQVPGVGDGQGGLVCYSPWSRKESDRTEQLTWTEFIWKCICRGKIAGSWVHQTEWKQRRCRWIADAQGHFWKRYKDNTVPPLSLQVRMLRPYIWTNLQQSPALLRAVWVLEARSCDYSLILCQEPWMSSFRPYQNWVSKQRNESIQARNANYVLYS